MSKDVILKKVDDIEWNTITGGFKYKIIAEGDKFMTGMGVAQPGAGETWHRHTDAVEETYYVLRGEGEMSWKADGKVSKVKFRAGDSMYLPFGCENEFINTGDGELWVLFNITKADRLRE